MGGAEWPAEAWTNQTPPRYDRLLALRYATRLRRGMLIDHGRDGGLDGGTGPLDGDQALLKESIDLVAPTAADVIGHFYAVLFHNRPYLRDFFPIAMEAQRDRLLHALLAVVGSLDQPGLLAPVLEQLGRDHRKFGIVPAHYAPVGEALIAALKHYSGHAWRPEFEQAWLRAYTFAAGVMTAAAEAANALPPYWPATVVGHELRAPDLAVLTVRPQTPYHYEPGQFATLESPLRPRCWRPYSLATAPRPDSVLEFHVRSLGGGWVSRALVRQTSIGDALRLGPPIGTATVDEAGDRDLLLVGGGTGLAPMKAIVDGLSTQDGRRVTLVHAVRDPAGLYDLAALSALVEHRPAVTLVASIDNLREYPSTPALPSSVRQILAGRATDALRQLGDISRRAVYLAGPPAMLRACLDTLSELGLPNDQVHYDVISE